MKRPARMSHEVRPGVAEVLDQERESGYDRLAGYADFADRVVEMKWACSSS